MQAETQQNLQKEMQQMQQKFKSREDKAKKDHRTEMERVRMSPQSYQVFGQSGNQLICS